MNSNEELTVLNSNIRNGSDSAWFTNTCIDTDPKLKYLANDKYTLESNSPCIDSGADTIPGIALPNFDINNNERLRYAHIDMGAVEYDSLSYNSIENNQVQINLDIYPNPANEKLTVNCSNTDFTINCITITSIDGKIIYHPKINGSRQIETHILKPGIYLLTVNYNHIFKKTKLFVKK
jgi:hypothetical protein